MPPTSSAFSALRALSRLTRSSPRFNSPPLSPIFAIPKKPQSPILSALRYRSFSSIPRLRTSSQDPAEPVEPVLNASTPSSSSSASKRPPQPEYQLTFTCTPCGTRSTHRISKQGYHHGSVLITCPECRNRHVISDHLQIFGDRNLTIEDLMREQGQIVKKGTLSEDGDVEFWPEGNPPRQRDNLASLHKPSQITPSVNGSDGKNEGH